MAFSSDAEIEHLLNESDDEMQEEEDLTEVNPNEEKLPFDAWRKHFKNSKKNIFKYTDETKTVRRVRLTQGWCMYINENDYSKIESNAWYAHPNEDGLVYVRCGSKTIQLHRLLCGLTEFDGVALVDHINGNTLDNRIENLHITDIDGNSNNFKLFKTNTTGYNGVRQDIKRQYFFAEWREHKRVIRRFFRYGEDVGISEEEAKQSAIQCRKDADEQNGCRNGQRLITVPDEMKDDEAVFIKSCKVKYIIDKVCQSMFCVTYTGTEGFNKRKEFSYLINSKDVALEAATVFAENNPVIEGSYKLTQDRIKSREKRSLTTGIVGIFDYVTRSCFVVEWCSEGKRHKKQFGYKRKTKRKTSQCATLTKAQALEEAKTFNNTIPRKMKKQIIIPSI